MTNGYSEFTPEIVTKWEKALAESPNCEWNENKISEILPLIKKVGNLRIGKNQSLFGLSIISIENYSKNDAKLIDDSLAPLTKADILTTKDADEIAEWYSNTSPSWNSGNGKRWIKEFEVDGIKYRFLTDSYRNFRDLNIQVLKATSVSDTSQKMRGQ